MSCTGEGVGAARGMTSCGAFPEGRSELPRPIFRGKARVYIVESLKSEINQGSHKEP